MSFAEPAEGSHGAPLRTNKKARFAPGLDESVANKNLLAGNVIPLFCAHPELLVFRGNLDGAELPVCLKTFRLIEDGILAAQLFVNIVKRVGYVLKLEGEEGLPAGGFRQHLQAAIAFVGIVAQVRADGVNDYARALGHLNGLLTQHAALIVVAI